MKEQKVFFYNKGQRLAGILHIPDAKNPPAVIMVHGITVDKNEGGIFVRTAKKLCKSGFVVLRFDFRSHGESEGNSLDLSIAGELSDLEASIEFMKSLGFERIGLLAASFGGPISISYAAHKKDIECMILWNPILDYKSIFFEPKTQWGRKYFSKEKMKEMDKTGKIFIGSKKFAVEKKLFEEMKKINIPKIMRKIKCPTLIIHGNKDTYVPYEDSRKYYGLISAFSKLEIIKNAEHGFHNNPKHEKQVITLSLQFLKKWLK